MDNDNTVKGWFDLHKGDRVRITVSTGYAVAPGVVTFVGDDYVAIDQGNSNDGLFSVTFGQLVGFRSLEP
jgi:hypothetical protein